MALYEVRDFDAALAAARADCAIAALTRSAQGSVVAGEGAVHTIEAAPIARLVDTTGAGDLYAAGFLLGLARGFDLARCGPPRLAHGGRDPRPLRRPARGGHRPLRRREPASPLARNCNLDHGAVQRARRRCQYRAMRRLFSRARIRATYRAHATHILRPRPFRRGRLGRARPCPEESHLSHLIPPNPAHKLSCKTRYSARTTLRACATSHLIPLNPGESRQELSRARVGTRNWSATLGRVEDWRASVRVRWLVRRFRSGPQSGSHGRVSSPRSSNRTCGFPASGFRTRSCLRVRKAHGPWRQASEAVVIA